MHPSGAPSTLSAMDSDAPTPAASVDDATSASRRLAAERQKHELRRERDHLVIDLVSSLGEDVFAERFGLTPSDAHKMRTRAQDRLQATAPPDARGEIAARRLRPDADRWADADAHYEALGRGAVAARVRRVSERGR